MLLISSINNVTHGQNFKGQILMQDKKKGTEINQWIFYSIYISINCYQSHEECSIVSILLRLWIPLEMCRSPTHLSKIDQGDWKCSSLMMRKCACWGVTSCWSKRRFANKCRTNVEASRLAVRKWRSDFFRIGGLGERQLIANIDFFITWVQTLIPFAFLRWSSQIVLAVATPM